MLYSLGCLKIHAPNVYAGNNFLGTPWGYTKLNVVLTQYSPAGRVQKLKTVTQDRFSRFSFEVIIIITIFIIFPLWD